MELLKNISNRLQIVNETFGQINADMIDSEIIRESSLELWKNNQAKELDINTDENGTFKINFDGI